MRYWLYAIWVPFGVKGQESRFFSHWGLQWFKSQDFWIVCHPDHVVCVLVDPVVDCIGITWQDCWYYQKLEVRVYHLYWRSSRCQSIYFWFLWVCLWLYGAWYYKQRHRVVQHFLSLQALYNLWISEEVDVAVDLLCAVTMWYSMSIRHWHSQRQASCGNPVLL